MMIERFYKWLYEIVTTLIAIIFLILILVLLSGFTIAMSVIFYQLILKLITEGIF